MFIIIIVIIIIVKPLWTIAVVQLRCNVLSVTERTVRGGHSQQDVSLLTVSCLSRLMHFTL